MEEKYLKTYFLINFKNLKQDEIVKAFINFIKAVLYETKIDVIFEKYSLFLEFLKDNDFSKYIKEKLFYSNSENVADEINIISDLVSISLDDIKNKLGERFPNYKSIINTLPKFKNSLYQEKIIL